MSTASARKSKRTLVLATLVAVVCASSLSVPSAGALSAMWSQPDMIASGESNELAVDEDSIYVGGWSQLTVSHDSGSTWSSVPGEFSRICADGGTIYRASGFGDYFGQAIWLDKSTDDGQTWTDPSPIMTLEGNNDASFGISKIGTRLVFYTLDGQPGGNEFGAMVKFLWSDDGGSTWSAPVLVDEGLYMEDPLANDIVYANGALYLAYYDQNPGFDNVDVIVAKSTDMGETWTTAVAAVGPYAHNPVIAADPVTGELFVSYLSMIVLPDWTLVDAGPRLVKSMDGISWSAPVKIGEMTLGTDMVGFHSLVAYDGMVFEGYLDFKGHDVVDGYDVRISCSVNDGVTWSDMGDVTGLVSNSVYPMLAITEGRLHFFWSDFGMGDPWRDIGNTYHRSMLLDMEVIGEATVLRQSTGSPAKDAKTISYTPEKDGLMWVSAVGNKLPVLKVDVYTKGIGKPTLVSTQFLVFGGNNQVPQESSRVPVLAGHEYTVKLTPYGSLGASAQVTGMFVAG